MAEEVEGVHRLHEVGNLEERALNRLLQGESGPALERHDPLRVRHRLRPVRVDEVTAQLVDLEAQDDDEDLLQPVSPTEPRPGARHSRHSKAPC